MSTTKIDFSALKLTVMDFNAYSHTDPEIFVNRSGITFSRGVLETLNYPSYVQYLIDPKSHVFAVRACKGNETKQSAVLRAKRDIDFVMTISISPASQSAIIALNSSRLRVFVPVIPSSAYILTSSYVGWLAT